MKVACYFVVDRAGVAGHPSDIAMQALTVIHFIDLSGSTKGSSDQNVVSNQRSGGRDCYRVRSSTGPPSGDIRFDGEEGEG